VCAACGRRHAGACQNCGSSFIALATPRVEEVAAGRITFVGGARVDSAFSRAPGPRSEFQATLRFLPIQCGESACGFIGTSANSLTLPYLNVDEPGTVGQARIIVMHSPICWPSSNAT